MSKLSRLIVVLGLAAIAAGIYLWWQHQQAVAPQDVPPAITAPSAEAPPAEPAAPEIKYPVEAIAPTPEAQAAPHGDDLGSAVANLVGIDPALKFLQLTDFPRRIVATVDNLARAHAAPALWPVNPTPGRFTVDGEGAGASIAAGNSSRYQPFVSMAQSLDTDKLLAIYVRFYPLLQRAYGEIGFPRGYFNDRLVAVIDNLLATPEPSGPLALTLIEVKGDIKLERPWLHYEYADPALESLSSGQKILIRVGAESRRILKAKLAVIRARIAGGAILK